MAGWLDNKIATNTTAEPVGEVGNSDHGCDATNGNPPPPDTSTGEQHDTTESANASENYDDAAQSNLTYPAHSPSGRYVWRFLSEPGRGGCYAYLIPFEEITAEDIRDREDFLENTSRAGNSDDSCDATADDSLPPDTSIGEQHGAAGEGGVSTYDFG